MREGANWSNKTLHSASDWLQPGVGDLGFLLLHGDYGHTSLLPSWVLIESPGAVLGGRWARSCPASHLPIIGQPQPRAFVPALAFPCRTWHSKASPGGEHFPKRRLSFFVCHATCFTLCNPIDCSPPGSSVHGDSLGKNTGVGRRAFLQGIFHLGRPRLLF